MTVHATEASGCPRPSTPSAWAAVSEASAGFAEASLALTEASVALTEALAAVPKRGWPFPKAGITNVASARSADLHHRVQTARTKRSREWPTS